MRIERTHETGKRSSQPSIAVPHRKQRDLLLVGRFSCASFMALSQQTSDLQRRKMLSHVGGLLDRYRRLALNDERIEIFSQKSLNGLRERPNNSHLQFFQGIENG